MSGYVYCMKNTHRTYGKYVKVGYTERRPEDRRVELSEKWRCTFTILWDMDVYDPPKAEYFIHTVLHRFRVKYEFFAIDADAVKALAEKHFDEHWREIEGKEILPESVADLVEKDARGFVLAPPPEEFLDPELGLNPDHGPDSDTE